MSDGQESRALADELSALKTLAGSACMGYMLLSEDARGKKLTPEQKLTVIRTTDAFVRRAQEFFSPLFDTQIPSEPLETWSDAATSNVRERICAWLYQHQVTLAYDTCLRRGMGRLMYAQTITDENSHVTVHLYPELLSYKQQKLQDLGWARTTLQLEVQTLAHECFHVWEALVLANKPLLEPMIVKTRGISRRVRLDVASELCAHKFAQIVTHYPYAPPFDDYALLVDAHQRDLNQFVNDIMSASKIVRSI